MGQAYWGGGARKRFFRLKADHSGLLQLDGVTEATLLTHAALDLKDDDEHIIETSKITYDDDGVPNFSITHTKMDAVYNAFEEVAAPKKASDGNTVTKNERISEAGKKIGGTTAGSGVPFVCIDEGPTNGTDRLCHIMVGTFKKSAGGVEFKNGDSVVTTLDFVGVPAKVAIALLAALFDATRVTVGATQTLPKDWYIKRLFLPLPA